MAADIPTLQESLRRHDPLDIAAGSAALSLIPNNIEHAERFHALSLFALSGEVAGSEPISPDDWIDWLRESPSLHEGLPWNPPEDVLTVPVVAPGGSYVVPTAGEVGNAFDLQLLVDALVLADWPAEADEFRPQVGRLLMGGLRLADHVAKASGLVRYQPAERSAKLEIPAEAEFQQAMAGVDLTMADVEAVSGVSTAELDPLIHDFNAGPLSSAVNPSGTSALSVIPIVLRDERFVIADPAALGVALRHHILLAALSSEWQEDLMSLVHARMTDRIKRAAEFMNWDPQATLGPEPGTPIHSRIYGFDTDKACHVALIGDDLAGYDRSDPRGFWDLSAISQQLENRKREVEWGLLMGPPPRPNELTHLVVLGTLGRSAIFAPEPNPPPLNALQELLSVEGVSTLGMLGLDRLTFWKFSHALDELRRDTHVVPMTPLAPFGAWWENQQSFYLSDDQRPDSLLLASDYERSLREEVAKHDVHAVQTPAGTFAEVVRLYGDPVPVYAPIHDLGGQPRQLVEGAKVPIWVTGPASFAQPEERQPSMRIVDCIAYWLWQLTPSLPDLSPIGPLLHIEVTVEDPAAWLGSSSDIDAQGLPAQIVVSDTAVEVTVKPAMLPQLNEETNAAERALMELVLEGIDELLAAQGQPLGSTERRTALDTHAPLGPKKKITVFGSHQSPALVSDGLPDYRVVSESDLSSVLDYLGRELNDQLQLSPGSVEGDQRVRVLNAGSEILFQELQRLIATLSPEGLLENLIAMHEALLHQGEFDRRTVGARLACFGEELGAEFREALPQSARAGIAVRFLIEYIVSTPPQGLRPFSLGIYDRCMALALEIANLGMSSDVIHYKLEDSQLGILESGRLGLDTAGAYTVGQQAFMDVAAPAQVREAAAAFARSWERGQPQPAPFMPDLNDAARAEWGFTMTEIAEFLTATSQAGFASNPRAACEDRAVLKSDLAERLDWTEDRVEAALEIFALRPRGNYLPPGDPYESADVYPWRFNRRLSYLRRPLLIRETDSGENVVWGPRHVDVAGRHLMNLILSERLKAQSDEMKLLMTHLKQEDAKAFNDSVADLFEQAGFDVRRRFEKANHLKIRRQNGELLGDVDALVVDNPERVLVAVECKDLEGARTPAELANEIENTFGTGGAKSSALDKHLERIQWLDEHLAEVLASLGIDDPADGWQVTGRLVVDVDVMAPYVIDCPLPVSSAHQLRDELGVSP